ncbi:MAG: hypothetical protein U1E62_13375 [Alsobacter sp.]
MTTGSDIPAVPPDVMGALRDMLEAMRAGLAADLQVRGSATAAIILDAALLDAGDEAAATFESLSRKVEVGRALRAAYAGGLGAALVEDVVPPAIATYLAALLVHAGLSRRDWKFINTAVKMEDGILTGLPVVLPGAAGFALRCVLGEAR